MAQARRAPAPKVRTRTFNGCLTCRTRKVKCSLERPSCNHCVRLGLQCHGYQVQLQWLPGWDPDQADTISPGSLTTKDADGRRNRTEIFDAQTRSRLSEDLVRHLSTMQASEQLDQVLERLDEQVTDSRHARAEESWQISRGPFSVMQLLSEPDNDSSRGLKQLDTHYPGSSAPISEVLEPVHNTSGSDWSLSVSDPNIGDQELFIDALVEENLDFSFSNTSNTSSLEEGAYPSEPFTACTVDMGFMQPQPTKAVTPGILSVPSLSHGSPYVPSNVRFLLSHYVNHVIASLSGSPQTEAPWKGIHVPYAMTAYGELDLMGQSSLARVSLLYSLLSLTCYHLGTLHKPTSTADGNNVQVMPTENQASNVQHWNSQGLKFREIARTAFRKCLQEMSTEKSGHIRYKEVFVSAMNMICTGIVSGDPWDSRLFILQCEEIVNKIGRRKATFSKRALQLHRIFAYIRVIESTTFVQTRDQYLATLGMKPMLASEIELVKEVPENSFPHSAHLASNNETWADLGLSGPAEDAFNNSYGMPVPILRLMARTNNIVNQVNPPQHHGTSQPDMSPSLAKAAATLERDICHWHSSEKQAEMSNDTLDSLICNFHNGTPDSTPTMRSDFLITAMHHAILVYFFRFVRGTNPIILQHYVESILTNLELHHEAKHCFYPGVRLGITVWPSFIAACEALADGLRQRAILCMRHAAWTGFQNAEAAEMVAREVWRRRDAGEMHVSWSTVLRESKTILLLT